MSAEKPTFEVVFGPTEQAVEAKLPWEKIVDFGKHASKRWSEVNGWPKTVQANVGIPETKLPDKL